MAKSSTAEWVTLSRMGEPKKEWRYPTIGLIIGPQKPSHQINYLHDLPTSKHFATEKTLNRVQERFYWVGYTQDVRHYCESCDLCASWKGPKRKPRGQMQRYNVGAPMERVAVDILGLLPTYTQGNKYVLIATDYFTKWP